ncbi:hypothetical protein EV646_11766 [Kribbella antiqua]|uniref:Uncharacterized protein n=1 Tax=Kribbella antiqua TaxID=2512217 RepID=A0A4R2ID45_9ACTN|nr:hypothetical protein EV646_11766 [Kribbella antiqua]
MKLGLNLLNYGPGTTPEVLLGWARFAEENRVRDRDDL